MALRVVKSATEEWQSVTRRATAEAVNWTPSRLAALRAALLAEANRIDSPHRGFMLACLACIQTTYPHETQAINAGRLRYMISAYISQAMWRRVCDRARRLMRSEVAS
jgi:hypothetical protein